jgi:hypothetical protein
MATSHQLAELEARTRRSRLLDPTERQQLEDLQQQPDLSVRDRKKVEELLLLAASLAKTPHWAGIRSRRRLRCPTPNLSYTSLSSRPIRTAKTSSKQLVPWKRGGTSFAAVPPEKTTCSTR